MENVYACFGRLSSIRLNGIPTSWGRGLREKVARFARIFFNLFSSASFFAARDRVYAKLLENRRRFAGARPLVTKIYAIGLRIFGYRKKESLYCYQNSLPSLPLPALNKTLSRYLESISPIVSSEQYAETEKKVKQFLTAEGVELQRRLCDHQSSSRNWLSAWWDVNAYLRNRESLALTTNWYGIDRNWRESPGSQIARASRIIRYIAQFHKMIMEETLAPIKLYSYFPLCTDQYSRLFGTCRLPGALQDRNETYSDSRHVAVFCRDRGYVFDIYDAMNNILSIAEIEEHIKEIRKEADAAGEESCPVNFLTALGRAKWCRLREEIKNLSPENAKALAAIERALFVICLDDSEPSDYVGLAKNMLLTHKNRWFDKSCSIIICANGYLGGNIEHSWGDAPIVSHLEEYFLDQENSPGKKGNLPSDYRPRVEALQWRLNGRLRKEIYEAGALTERLMTNVDLQFREIRLYGKDFIKGQSISPDAYFQMALQLAYYKIHKEFVLTYETAATRLFYHGKTETIRSVTMKSRDFVLKMMDVKSDKEARLRAFREAQQVHVANKELAINGEGVDRHMLGLRIVAASQGYEPAIFTDSSYRLPWKMATSQTPSPSFKGGGFLPLAEDGYGVSYNVHPDCFDIHVTSFKSCLATDSALFIEKLEDSLLEMRELF